MAGWLHGFRIRCAALFHRRRLSDEMEEELAFHQSLMEERLKREGATQAEAEQAARQRFGNLARWQERCAETRQFRWIEELLRDVKLAARMIGRRPLFAALVITVLALGIGADAAIFSMVSAVMLRPLPYENPKQLTLIFQSTPGHRNTGMWFDEYSELHEWQRSSHSFQELAGLSWAVSGSTMLWHGKPINVTAFPVTANFFSMLGISALYGRTFTASDLSSGCSVVLAHDFWQNQLGAPADLVNKIVPIDGEDCRVEGVMPKTFSFYPKQAPIWKLITPGSVFYKDPWTAPIAVFGRLKPGITRATAASELTALDAHILPQAPPSFGLKAGEPVVLDLQSEFTWLAGRNLSSGLLMLLGAVTLVLFIACVNVACLLLGRTLERHRELAVRASLGADKVRLLRQMLTEALLLSCAGAVLGLTIAYTAVAVFNAHNPVELPPGGPVAVDWRALLFTIGATVLATLLSGALPAWRAAHGDLNEVLKGASNAVAGGPQRTLRVLVVLQVALSVVLLAGAGLLSKSLMHLADENRGFNSSHLLTGWVTLPNAQYHLPGAQVRFFKELIGKVSMLPGVRSAAAASAPLPRMQTLLAVQGRHFDDKESPDVNEQVVSDGYFTALSIPLLRGRVFAGRDRHDSQPVVIINEALAQKYFPGLDPIGRALKLGRPEDASLQWLTVVGLVGDIKTTTVFEEMGYVEAPTVYEPLAQTPALSMALMVKTAGYPLAQVPSVQRQIPSIDNGLKLSGAMTLDEYLSGSRDEPRFRAILLSSFAGLTLLLAAMGIYGLLAGSVVRRTSEIGIRIALGAQRVQVVTMVLRENLWIAAIGGAAGLAVAVLASKLLGSFLYATSPRDPGVMALAAALLALVASVASIIPAIRAARIDPATAIRTE